MTKKIKTLFFTAVRIALLYRIFVRRAHPLFTVRLFMFFIKRFILNEAVPVSVMIALTYKCQCDCGHCAAAGLENNAQDELSTDEVKKVLDQAARIGALKVGFSGGEPLMRKDIVSLVSYAYKKGLSVSIDTNGIMMEEPLVCSLALAGVTNINVSLDSPQAKVHDHFRKYQGAFKKAVQAVISCGRHKIPCVLSTYMTDRSLKRDDTNRIIVLAKKINATAVRVMFPVYCGKLDKAGPLLSPKAEEEFFTNGINGNFVYSESPLFDFLCRKVTCASKKKLSVYVTAYGDLKYCYASAAALGNLRAKPMESILREAAYFDFRKKIKIDCVYA